MIPGALQIPREVLGRRIALLGILGEQALDDPPDRGRSLRGECPSGSGSSRMIATRVSAPVFRWKARLPVAISYRIAPSENWSDRKSTGWPLACSGDMYPTVPMTVPGAVAPIAVGRPDASCETVSVSLARPKSRILT